MSGWDRDQGGDYVPPNPPVWIWIALAALIIGPFVLYMVFG